MKKLFFLLALLGISPVQAQNLGDSAIHRWQIGVVLSDLSLPSLSLEANLKLESGQEWGLWLSLPGMWSDPEGSDYDGLNYGLELGLHHRWRWRNRNPHGFFLKHGLRYGQYEPFYQSTGFYPAQENGLDVLRFEERRYYETIRKLSYVVCMALQDVVGSIYYEYYLGLRYEQILNPSQIQTPAVESNFRIANHFRFEGLSPVIGLTVGFGR